jgi:hypothetical protein
VAGEPLQDDGQITKILGKQQIKKSSDHLSPTAFTLEDLLSPKQQMPKNSQGELKYKAKCKNSNKIKFKSQKQHTIKIILSCILHLVALGDTPIWLIEEIKKNINTTENTPRSPELRFDLSNEAAVHNMRILQRYDNDLQRYLLDNHDTFIGFGSEFRRICIIEPLLLHHPNWRKFKMLLEKGSD